MNELDPLSVLGDIQGLIPEAKDLPLTFSETGLELTDNGFKLRLGERLCVELYDEKGDICFRGCLGDGVISLYNFSGMVHSALQRRGRELYERVVNYLLAV